MKPNGVRFHLDNQGLRLHLHKPTRTEDAIWNAVEEAVNEGWTPKQFMDEVISAWEEKLQQYAKQAIWELSQ